MNELRIILNRVATVAALFLIPASAAAQDPEAIARRVAAIASIAVDEYRLGVANGAIVQAAEYEEAVLFLSNARADAGDLPVTVQSHAFAVLDSLIAGVNGLRAADQLAAFVADLRAHLAAGLGITLDPLPAQAPSLAVGARVWTRVCAQCHGTGGAGDGPLAAGMDPSPANLRDPILMAATPLEFFRKVTFGVAGTAMPAYEGPLSLEERWSVALYASGLRYRDADRDAGRVVVATCDPCRLALADFQAALLLDDHAVAALAAVDDSAPAADVQAYARTAAALEELGGDRHLRLARVLEATATQAAAAAELARSDGPAAQRAAIDAYLVFEAVEVDVRVRRPDLATQVEAAFAHFRSAIASGNQARVTATHLALDSTLRRVETTMVASEDAPLLLFGQSLLIILREGLEAILILGALTAVLVKAGAGHRRKELGWGALAALGASGVAAVLMLGVFHIGVATQEVLEGVTMLVAAVVLFTVASWLVSKVEAARWRAFVGDKLRAALASRGRFALVGLAFLVVFREGVETVLFYGALYATADTSVDALGVTSGIAVGAVVLTVLYVAMNKWGVRLPLRPIFGVTGVLLLLMAFSFAGQGVAELQAGGVLPITALNLPSLPALGIFPTVQTLLAQGALLAAFAAAVALLLRRPVAA